MSDWSDEDEDPFIPVWEGPYTDAQLLRLQLEESHVPVELGDALSPGEARVMVPRSYLSEVRDVISGDQAKWPSVSVHTDRGVELDPRMRLAFAAIAALVLIGIVIAIVTRGNL